MLYLIIHNSRILFNLITNKCLSQTDFIQNLHKDISNKKTHEIKKYLSNYYCNICKKLDKISSCQYYCEICVPMHESHTPEEHQNYFKTKFLILSSNKNLF